MKVEVMPESYLEFFETDPSSDKMENIGLSLLLVLEEN